MPPSNVLTYDQSPWHRPGIDELGGFGMRDVTKPRDPRSVPSALTFAQLTQQIVGGAKGIPSVRLQIEFVAGSPVITQFQALSTLVRASDFRIQRNGPGDISIFLAVWQGESLLPHELTIAEDVEIDRRRIFPIVGGWRVKTKLGAAGVDAAFVVALHAPVANLAGSGFVHAVLAGSAQSPSASLSGSVTSIPSILTQSGNAQLYWDARYSPGAVDGSPITALTNLSGSNATFDAANNYGFGAVALPTYRATLWEGEPCLEHINAGSRFLGSDLTGVINGIGHLWCVTYLFEQVLIAQATDIPCGWTSSALAAFSGGMLTWITNVAVPGTAQVLSLQGQAGDNVADTQRFTAMNCFQMFRPDSAHVQLAFNGVLSPPIAYANGTNFNVDGFGHGIWNNSANNGLNASHLGRACVVHGGLPDLAAVRSALCARAYGPTLLEGMGAT